MTHVVVPEGELEKWGFDDTLLRLSGTSWRIQADLQQALDRVSRKPRILNGFRFRLQNPKKNELKN